MNSIRAEWERHIEAGTCYICKKPVVDGEAVHSVTGAHWDCQEVAKARADEALRELPSLLNKAQYLLNRL